MLVHESVLSYIIDTSTAHEAWETLESAFKDIGLCRKVELLKQLVQLTLDGCDSVEDYINKITMTSLKVKRTGLNLDDEVIASLMLAGLPNEYQSLAMAIENSTDNLTSDSVKTLLLQEPRLANKKGSDGAFLVKSKKVGAAGTFKYRCHTCGEVGHMAKDCAEKDEKKSSANFVTYSTPRG